MQNTKSQYPAHHHKYERTFVMVKPDGIQRNLVGEIISRFERIGLKLVAIRMEVPSMEMVRKHYTLDPEWMQRTGEKSIQGYVDKGLTPPLTDPIAVSERVLERLSKYLTKGPVIPMIWEGAHSVQIVRKLVGKTEPLMSDVGTIRGDYVLDSYVLSDTDNRSIRNVIHASGSIKEAHDEIDLWFKPEEIQKYTHVQEAIVYNADLDGILE